MRKEPVVEMSPIDVRIDDIRADHMDKKVVLKCKVTPAEYVIDFVRLLPALGELFVKRIWFNITGMETKTRMCYWYPKVEGMPMPKTVMLKVNLRDSRLLKKGWTRRVWRLIYSSKYTEELYTKIKEKANEIGYPLFIRTDLTSHKKDPKNNTVHDETELLDKVGKLIKFNNKWEQREMRALVFREYIPLYIGFHLNGRPVTKERRYYVKDGKVLCHSERSWISSDRVSTPAEYRPMLKEINTETEDEVKLLTEMAEEFSRRVPDHIAVDFAMSQNGKWLLIEANDAITSWHSRERCEYHPLWPFGSAVVLKK